MQYQVNSSIYWFYWLKKNIDSEISLSMENKNTVLKTSSAWDGQEQDAASKRFTDI